MASRQETVDYIVEQTSDAGDVRARRMFGEYGMHCDGKFVALICDDRFFVKATKPGLALLGEHETAAPYDGAKPYPIVSEERWDDRAFMSELIRVTASALPAPKPKKKAKT
ncbi:TfoX/Sxy family protein [Parvularcula maris]|uniref:TfoX/Sxy family protein n=1 Tax=Parvularcula maris TaxID=2965077 RepID=A0A9X2L827_9PROT|nr:TfoX/Sxy family protein [Parvularcula maris]MCQ8184752.1 TfoX/Sxy family protein [Parvularcula maris]